MIVQWIKAHPQAAIMAALAIGGVFYALVGDHIITRTDHGLTLQLIEEVGELRNEVVEIHRDTTNIKDDVREIKEDVEEINGKVHNNDKRITVLEIVWHRAY